MESGNIEIAKEIAEKLAKRKTNLTVQVLETGVTPDTQQVFNIHIQVEDKEGPGPSIKMLVNPVTTTVGMLKHMVSSVTLFF